MGVVGLEGEGLFVFWDAGESGAGIVVFWVFGLRCRVGFVSYFISFFIFLFFEGGDYGQ